MKKIVCLTALLLASFTYLPTIQASEKPSLEYTLSVPLTKPELSPSIILVNNKPLYAVRFINNALQYKTSWDALSKTTVVANEKSSASLKAGNLSNLTTAPVLSQNILYAPADFWETNFNVKIAHSDTEILITLPLDGTLSPNEELEDNIFPLFEGTNTYYTHQKVSVCLTENPSTAYMWEVKLPQGIELVSDEFVGSHNGLAGAPGEHTWVLRATEPGTYTITFNQLRSFEPDNIIDTKTFILKARPSSSPSK